jgi:triacylglycerol lipase
MASKVASITTVATPHRGSRIADVLLGLNADTGGWITGLVDTIYIWLFGGKQNSAAAARYLSVSYMTNTFNPGTPNQSGVYYQSWASKIYFPCLLDKAVFAISGALLYFYDGANDGLVAESSAKWGTFRGTKSGSILGSGVSHVNTCDQFLNVTPFFDCLGFYTSIASDLKSKGY